MHHQWTFKALTPIWTGDQKGSPERLISTGLLGSIRWWFEVLVRGLDGNACDPTKTKCQDLKHCVVCELFGCTGWARKFRFDVLDESGCARTDQIAKDNRFTLRFTPLRPIRGEEWGLLDVTLRLIAGYGAIGGKTVFKPTDENNRLNAPHHQDYGLVALEGFSFSESYNKNQLENYVRGSQWIRPRHEQFWASLNHFWAVQNHYLARKDRDTSTFNKVIGRPEPKIQAAQNDSWLAGRRAGNGRQPESKKVFSFKEPPRTFGFFNPPNPTLEDIKQQLKNVWKNFQDNEIHTTNDILRNIFKRRIS